MNVLITHRYFWPEEISTLPIMLREVVNLHLARGDDVTVVTGASEKNMARWSHEFGSAVKIHFFQSEIDRTLSNIGRLKNMARLFFLAVGVLRKKKFDLLYTVSYPPGMSAALAAVCRFRKDKTKVIFYVQDILSYRLGSTIMRSVYEKLFSYTCVRAHRIITLTGDMESEILNICGASAEVSMKRKVSIIPNYSPDLYMTDDSDYAVVRNGAATDVSGSINIVYAGNHGEAQNLSHFIRVLASDKCFRDLSVVFFGEGTSKPALMKLAAELNVSIDFRDPVSREEINRVMVECQLGLVGAKPGLMRYAFPSKLASYNAADVPGLVMCDQESSLSNWLSENGIGFGFDPVCIDKAREDLKHALARSGGFDALHVRSAAKSIYSLDTYVKQFKDQIFSTLN